VELLRYDSDFKNGNVHRALQGFPELKKWKDTRTGTRQALLETLRNVP